MRILPWLALAAALAVTSCSLFGGGDRANLLVITVDSLRYDALSRSLGAPSTPHLQALASDGQAFSHCFSHSPVALPAHVALFSARLPHQSGVLGNGMAVDPDVTLLAEWMRSRGYSTAAAVSLASLWPPTSGSASSTKDASSGLERGFASYAVGEHELEPAQEVNERLLAQLDAMPKDQPWFLFAQYSEPRAPYEANSGPEVRARVKIDGKQVDSIVVSGMGRWEHEFELAPGVHEFVIECETPVRLRRIAAHGPREELRTRFVAGRPEDAGKRFVLALENPEKEPVPCRIDAWVHDVPDVVQARARYRLEVEAVDRAVGALLQALRDRNQYENTVIVFTADHGESLGEHGQHGRAYGLYDEVLRIPLILKPNRGNDRFGKVAKLEHAHIRQIDIVPTVLDLMGLRPLPGAEGSPLRAEADRTHFAEVHPPDAAKTVLSRRDGRYKLIFTCGADTWEMYDVTSDTMELDNVFEVQGHFRANWQAELRQIALRSPRAANARMGMTEKQPEYLKSLGY